MMEGTRIKVENIKCGGCAASITRRLGTIPGVGAVEVSVADGEVSFTADGVPRATVAQALAELGYPEPGGNGIGAKAKSFVSCAVGRVAGE